MYDNIRNQIDSVIKEHPPESVLFSGGVDSSAILYNAHRYNPDVMGITVGVQGKESSDIEYSRMVAKELGIKNHQIFYVEPEKIKDIVETSVRILKSFNPEWISSTTTLLLGTMYAKNAGLKSISSGEGADDLLGSFPFFQNWNGDYKSLDKAIRDRLDEIVVMSDVIAQSMDMQYIAPFHDSRVKKEILSIPIEERMKQDSKIKTKYPLRKAYEGVLPPDCITRPQTMAFTGSGVYETIRSIGDNISDKEFSQACNNIFKFKSKFEYALFKIYNKNFEFKQQNQGGCIHCGCSMGNNKINCKTCATLQIDGKELTFDGKELSSEGENLAFNGEKLTFDKKDTSQNEIKGAEGIVLHNGNIVLGMQKAERWYTLEDGKTAAIVKTLGGQIEDDDENSSKKALLREVLEETQGIGEKEIKVSKTPIFTKKISMGELNPYESKSNLSLTADFYLLEILSKKNILPNDLPALIEIPLEKFLNLDFNKKGNLSSLQNWVIKNNDFHSELPEQFAFMIPPEVKTFFEKSLGDGER